MGISIVWCLSHKKIGVDRLTLFFTESNVIRPNIVLWGYVNWIKSVLLMVCITNNTISGSCSLLMINHWILPNFPPEN